MSGVRGNEGKPRVCIIGAGGYIFPIRLAVDILSFPDLENTHFSLMDIHPGRLRLAEKRIRALIRNNNLPATVSATTNPRRALEGADYVIVAFQVGGMSAYKWDVEIPRRYGIDQPVGDTLGPGGIFRALRSIPVFMKIARHMREVCPGALMIQYANPMSMNCWSLNEVRTKVIGFCHSVQYTSQFLAQCAGVPYKEITFKCAGVNHQAWFTDFRHKGRDVYPDIRKALRFASGAERKAGRTGGKHETDERTYGYERVRAEIMRMTGYFHTESSHHGSEYVPWFRKNPRAVNRYLPKRWDYYRICSKYGSKSAQDRIEELIRRKPERGEEYGAVVINSMETGVPAVVYGNVPNYGRPGSDPGAPGCHLIPNLPPRCCVELACLVDKNGVQPIGHGLLPEACAAVNGRMVAVQGLAVEGALTGDREKVHQAAAMDPFAGMILTLPRIREMVNAMFRAERQWLPQFKDKG